MGIAINKLTINQNISGTLNGIYSGTNIYIGGNSSATVLTGTKVFIIATESVVIDKGFEIQNGGSFEATISANCQ